jgi:hypothetical protein
MATSAQYLHLLSEIRSSLNEISSLNIEDDLVRTSTLGVELSFEASRHILLPLLDLVRLTRSLSLDLVPFGILQSLHARLNECKATIDAMKGFRPAKAAHAAQARDQIQQRIEETFNNLYQATLPVLLSNALVGTSQEDLKGQAKETLRELDELKSEAERQLEEVLGEARSTLAKQKDAAAETGATRHAALFADEAKDHNDIAKKWLLALFGILVITAVAALSLLFVQLKDIDAIVENTLDSDVSMDHVQFTISKVLLVAVCFYGLAIASKNYKAHRHNAVVNKHRQNALQTFETFVKAASDSQTKNAVLLEAARTIFGNQPTGYLVKEGESDTPSRIIEVFKSADKNGAS